MSAGSSCRRAEVAWLIVCCWGHAHTLTSAKVQKYSQSDKRGRWVGGEGVLSGSCVINLYKIGVLEQLFVNVIYGFLRGGSIKIHEKH